MLDYHKEIKDTKPDIVKIATVVNGPRDCLNMITLVNERDNTIAIPMGSEWYVLLTRILTLYHGGYLSFACLPGKATAKGQLDAYEFREKSLKVSDMYERTPGLRALSLENLKIVGEKIGLI